MSTNIQLICYTYISEKTPEYDMLIAFLSSYKCSSMYKEFFQTLVELEIPFPIGYAIKQTLSKEITFEIYFYQLDPSRKNHLDMYTVPNFPSDILNKVDTFLTQHLWEEEVFILSLNIDKEYFTEKKKQVTYYFLTGPVYFFTHKVCSEEGITYHTSDYSLAYIYPSIIETYPDWYEKASFYQPNEKDLFIGSKDHQERFGYYLQKISYDSFLHFLQEFQYSFEFIEICRNRFDTGYLFDVGFDFWKDGTLARTMLYGVLRSSKSS